MYIINKEISEVLYIMSSFYKKCCKIAGNLKLEPKLLLSTIGINLLFLLFFLVFAFSMITSRYHKLLYQSMQSSSALVSYEFTKRLEDLVSMTTSSVPTPPFSRHWTKFTSRRKHTPYITIPIFIPPCRSIIWNIDNLT